MWENELTTIPNPTPETALALSNAEEFSDAASILKAFAKVLVLREKVAGKAKFQRAQFPRKELETHFAKGEPARFHRNFRLDMEVLLSQADSFLELFVELNESEWAPNRTVMKDPNFRMGDLLKAFIEEDIGPLEEAAEGRPFTLPVLASFLQQLSKGYFIAFRDAAWPELPLKTWEKGYCPICGSFPAFGETDTDRNRILYCHLCESPFDYPWNRCPICAEPDVELKILELPGRPGYPIVLCEGCGRYLKHVDRSRTDDAPEFPFVDLVTFDIDALAQKQGYLKPSLSSFGY
ncbi:MAG: formate dehydrogenase accessory protein FdhE [Planctomycetota bacterium]|jgi:FdhE protein